MQTLSVEEQELIDIGNSVIQKCDELITLWNEDVIADVTDEWRKTCIKRDSVA